MTRPGAVIRIVLADDHVTVRQGLKLLIEAQPDMQVVAEASDGSGAVEQARTLKPEVVVMDISMPGVNGLVIDDLLATGGTAAATVRLIERQGGRVVGLAFVVELSFLHGRERLQGYPVSALVDYTSE